MQAIRLYCPNGKMAELGGSVNSEGKLFQLKLATRNFVVSANSQTETGREVLAHIVGIVNDLLGTCTLFAWEILPQPEPPLSVKPPPDPKSLYYRTAEPGVLTRDYQAWHKESERVKNDPRTKQWAMTVAAWEQAGRGILVGPMEDNVYGIRYQGIGALSFENLGMKVS
jgi:hypothetical protein